jgi:PAS domain S-box-containing protein
MDDLGPIASAIVEAARSARIGIVVTLIDEAEPRNIYVSPSLAEITGYSTRELLTRQPLSMIAPEELPRLRELFTTRSNGSHQGRLHYESVMLRKDGSRMHIEVSSCTVTLRGRRCVVAFMEDISARVTAQDARQKLESQLMLADRLSALGTLAAGVAHEINNPLAYLSLNLEWLERKLPEAAEHPETMTEMMTILREARAGAQRVAAIVRQLRTFSRAEEDAPRAVNLQGVVESAIKMASHELRHRARIVTDLAEVPAVWGNEARIEQVILNLLLNAAQAMKDDRPGNEVRVGLRREDEGHVAIEVSDNGEGIPPEIVGRIFDPFFTTKPAGVGTGLGLSICHSIVTGLGGRILVDTSGGGTSFRVILPARAASDHERAAPPVSGPSRIARRAKVLVVDDEVGIGATIRELLSPIHDVTAVSTATEGLELVERGAGYDVILCDLMMPTVSGMAFHDRVRALHPGMEDRMVFMTGGAFTQAAADFLARVPNPRIEKPFSLSTIEEVVASMARRPARQAEVA